MDFISKLFPRKARVQPHQQIQIYLDPQLRKSIQTSDQTVGTYIVSNQIQSQQFLYLTVIHRKTQQTLFRRKLNNYQKFSQCLANIPQDCDGYLMMGYNGQRNTVPKITTNLNLNDGSIKFIRAGVIYKYSDARNNFQQCQLRLHHDYLTYHKNRSKQKKVSFLPLQNSTVQMLNQKKCIFMVKDKFKSIMFKCTSKQDMIGWLVAINQAIKIRNAQIYMNQLQQKLNKKVKDKVISYSNKCLHLRDQARNILLDQIGRKSLRLYFKKYPCLQSDIKLLSIIQTYLYMCKCRRQKGQIQSQQIIISIKQTLKQMINLPQQISNIKQMQTKNQFVKVIQQIMKYLDKKYKKQILDKKCMYQIFQTYLLDDYKSHSKISMKSFLGNFSVNPIS